MELIDEMRAHLPILVHASVELSKLLILNGFDITPETQLNIIDVADSGDEGGIACFLDIPENFVISLTLLEVRQDHPLFQKISAYQRKRKRSIFRSRGLKWKA